MRQRQYGITLAWLIIVILLPFFGAFVYLLFGEKRISDTRAGRIRKSLTHYRNWIITIDAEFVLFGSVKIDMRSFRLNFETTLLIYDQTFTKELRKIQGEYELSSNKTSLGCPYYQFTTINKNENSTPLRYPWELSCSSSNCYTFSGYILSCRLQLR